MKIFLFSDLWLPFPGGAERYMVNVARQMVDKGHTVTVLTSYARALETYPGITLVVRDVGVYERHDHGLQVLREEVEKAQPDVILTHHFFAHEFKDDLPTFGKPLVQVVHNGNKLMSAAFAIYNSKYTKERSNCQEHDMIIHPSAFQDVMVGWTGNSIGMIKPIKHKGIEFVYQLAKVMKQENFLIVKGEWEEFNVIKPLSNVTFMEPMNDIRDFYSRCKVLLMPSLSEDAGTIPQEAAVNGIPCLSSNVMGLMETNAGGIILPTPLNVLQWRTEIEALTNDWAYRDMIVERQKEHLKTFQWEEKFEELHQRLLQLIA